jgi:hypothetical protein
MILVSQQALKICINIAVKKERNIPICIWWREPTEEAGVGLVGRGRRCWWREPDRAATGGGRAGWAWPAMRGGRRCVGPRRTTHGAMATRKWPSAVHGGQRRVKELGGGVEAARSYAWRVAATARGGAR